MLVAELGDFGDACEIFCRAVAILMTLKLWSSSQASLKLPMDEAKADSTEGLRAEKSPENRKCFEMDDTSSVGRLPWLA